MKKQYMRFLDNRNTSRLMALVLSLLLCISIIGIIASAASVTKDGLEVTLTTDKEEYSAEEPIVATLTVENKGDKIVDEVSLETLIPDGYHIDTTATAIKMVGELGVGEKAVLEVTLLPDSSATPDTPVSSDTPVVPGSISPGLDNQSGEDSINQSSSPSENTSDEKDKNNSTTTTTKSSTTSTTRKATTKVLNATTSKYVTNSATGSSATSSQANSSVKSVNTGDNSNLWIWSVLALISLICLLFVLAKKGIVLWKWTLSLVLIGALLGSICGSLGITSKAEGNRHRTVIIMEELLCANLPLRISGVVTVNPNLKEYANGDFISTPDEQHIKYDENSRTFYFDNMVCAYLIEPVSEKEAERLAGLLDGRVIGETKGAINYIQIGVKGCTFEELRIYAEMLQNEGNIIYATYDSPQSLVFPSDDNPWPDENGIIETDKQNELTPSGNDWWAEAVGAYSAWKYIEDITQLLEPAVGVIDNGFYEHDDLRSIAFLNDYSINSPETDHGTHVSGLVAAFNNTIGIRGIADKASLMLADWNYDVLETNGTVTTKTYFSTGDYIEVTKQIIESGAKIVNNSWGTTPSYDLQLYKDVLDGKREEEFEEKLFSHLKASELTATNAVCVILSLINNQREDFIIVQSAGNGLSYIENGEQYGFDSNAVDALYNGYYCSITETLYRRLRTMMSPEARAKIDVNYNQLKGHVLIVGAVENKKDNEGRYYLTDFSNYGENVDICAPGSEIISLGNNNGYVKHNGTSMAAPIVSGAASLLWGLNPDLSAAQIKDLLVDSNSFAVGVNQNKSALYSMLNISASIFNSPYHNNKQATDVPLIPGDISGIDDPAPSNPSEPTAPGDVGFASGKGTEEEPFVIMTPEQLNSVRYHLDANYVLGTDIDMSSWGNWEPIAAGAPNSPTVIADGSYSEKYDDDNKGYLGTFDGANHSIKNLTVDTNKLDTIGLFGVVGEKSEIKHLTLDNINFSVDKSGTDYDYLMHNEGGYWHVNVGGVAARANESSISSCKVSGSITVVNPPECSIGGIVGCGEANQSESEVKISVTSDRYTFTQGDSRKDSPICFIGGVAGETSTLLGEITDCVNRGDIVASGILTGSIGGIVGALGSISHSVNYGDINGSALRYSGIPGAGTVMDIGGIVGDQWAKECSVDKCVNYGNVLSSATPVPEAVEVYSFSPDDWCSAGGIVGYGASSSVSNCYNMGETIVSKDSVFHGTIIGYANDTNCVNCYSLSSSVSLGRNKENESDVGGSDGIALSKTEMEARISKM